MDRGSFSVCNRICRLASARSVAVSLLLVAFLVVVQSASQTATQPGSRRLSLSADTDIAAPSFYARRSSRSICRRLQLSSLAVRNSRNLYCVRPTVAYSKQTPFRILFSSPGMLAWRAIFLQMFSSLFFFIFSGLILATKFQNLSNQSLPNFHGW